MKLPIAMWGLMLLFLVIPGFGAFTGFFLASALWTSMDSGLKAFEGPKKRKSLY